MSIVGLDISDHNLYAVELKKRGQTLEVVATNHLALEPGIIEAGRLRQPERFVLAVQRLLAEAKPQAIKNKKVVVSLPDSVVFTHLFSFPTSLKAKQVIKALPFEAQEHIPVHLSEAIHDYQFLDGNESRHSLLYAAAEKEVVRDYGNVLRQAGLKPQAFDVAAVCLGRSLLSELPLNGKVMVVSIGAKTTSFAVFGAGGLQLAANLSQSGQDVTDHISQDLKIDLDQAEKRKKAVGLSNVKAEPKKKVMTSVLKSIQPIVEKGQQLIEFCQDELETPIEMVLVTGGSAQMKGLSKHLSQAWGLPVEIGVSWLGKDDDQTNDLDSPQYTTAVGLAMREFHFSDFPKLNLLKAKLGRSSEGKKKLKVPKIKVPKNKLKLVGALVFAVLGLGALLFVAAKMFGWWPMLTLTQSAEVTVVYNSNITDLKDFSDLTIFGRYIEIEKEIREEFTPTGESTEPAYAKGFLTVKNTANREQTLIATTRFLSADNVLFRLVQDVDIPAGQEAKVEVRADQPGAVGDIPAGQFTIPGLSATYQKLIYGISEEPMSGGAQKKKQVTQEDLEAVEKKFKGIYKNKAIEIMKESTNEDEIFFEDNVRVDLIASTDLPEVNAITQSFKVTKTVQVRGFAFNQQEVRELVEPLFKKEGFSEDKLKFAVINNDPDKKQALIKVFIEEDLQNR